MLRIVIPLSEVYDEEKNEFATVEGIALDLEHSLVSLSKWESKWEIPFLGNKPHTNEQIVDYVGMMVIGDPPSLEALTMLTEKSFAQINDYINAKMTATWFNERHAPRGPAETVTAEIIYYWMITLGIPFECQHWHLNKLLTLIKVCNYKNAPKKKMSRAEAASQQDSINKMRRQQLGTTG